MSKVVKYFLKRVKQTKSDKARMRHLCVACVFVLYITTSMYIIDANSFKEEANPVTTESILSVSITEKAETIYCDAKRKVETEKVKEEVNKKSIHQEDLQKNNIELEQEVFTVEEKSNKKKTTKTSKDKKKKEERENKLYYVSDDGYDFYLDEEYQDYLWKKLKEYDHTDLYEVSLALMYHESKFEKDTVSATNDHGLMQINAGNFSWLKKTLDIKSLDDPYDNIDCGVYILVSGYEKYGTVEEALIAYNRGSCGSIKSTPYSRQILNHDIKCLYALKKTLQKKE